MPPSEMGSRANTGLVAQLKSGCGNALRAWSALAVWMPEFCYDLPEKGVPILRINVLRAFLVAWRRTAMVTAAALVAIAPALAHHSFTMFDMTKRITLVGTVTAFEWGNPHAYIEIDEVGEAGELKHWSIELGSPSILMSSGWKFSSLKKGDKTTLVINPLKSGQAGGFLYTATLPDGRILSNGPMRQP